MHTEKEAKELWCPQALVLGTLIGRRDATEDDRTVAMGSQNRGYQMGGALDNCRCLASQCAMWRWGRDLPTEAERRPGGTSGMSPGPGWQEVPRRGGGTEWVRYTFVKRGYCGLAGPTDVQ